MRSTRFRSATWLAASTVIALAPSAAEEGKDPAGVFSGPQKGEKLLPFKVLGVYDEDAGKDIDFVSEAGAKPLFLVFVHKLTRPSLGLTRTLTDYCLDLGKERINARVVWLDRDASSAEKYLTTARKSLNLRARVGISRDGEEGPGAYGLNRGVTLTILIGKEGLVKANFALIQPSDTDAPRILAEAAALVGVKPPTIDDLAKYRGAAMERREMARPDPRLEEIVKRLDATDLKPEDVRGVAREARGYVGDDAARKAALGRLAKRLSEAADFEKRGTAESRGLIREWAREPAAPERDRGAAKKGGEERDPRLASLLRSMIQKGVSAEDVARIAGDVEKLVAENEALRRQLGDITTSVAGSKGYAEGGYGGPAAREQIKKWAEKYGEQKPARRV